MSTSKHASHVRKLWMLAREKKGLVYKCTPQAPTPICLLSICYNKGQGHMQVKVKMLATRLFMGSNEGDTKAMQGHWAEKLEHNSNGQYPRYTGIMKIIRTIDKGKDLPWGVKWNLMPLLRIWSKAARRYACAGVELFGGELWKKI